MMVQKIKIKEVSEKEVVIINIHIMKKHKGGIEKMFYEKGGRKEC